MRHYEHNYSILVINNNMNYLKVILLQALFIQGREL